ncbi:hypothetical protein TCON_2821, partial [Astathelohania contejeani]
NYDSVYKGYCFYTNNPQLFIYMIETHESYEESQSLSNMMTDDGIVFITDEKFPLEITDWIYSYKKLMMNYANCNLFFFYLLNRNVQWQSTPNYSVFENWRKKLKKKDDIHFHPNSNSREISSKEFISLIPVMKLNIATKFLTIIKYLISKSTIQILADIGLDTFSNTDFNIKQIDRVYHLRNDHWITSNKNKTSVTLYELMVRMQRLNQKPVYIEMIINFEDTMNGKEAVMFITEDAFIFTQTFLT